MEYNINLVEQMIEVKDILDYKTQTELVESLPYDSARELTKQTCETFTRLLLSITPYKAKEFVEKNCAKVTRKIMSSVNTHVIDKYTNKGGQDGDNETES